MSAVYPITAPFSSRYGGSFIVSWLIATSSLTEVRERASVDQRLGSLDTVFVAIN